ncbi:MAG: hypothetical protein ABEJ61_08530 [Haloferacaceae archaeon]
MTYFECERCGQLVDLVGVERAEVREACPVCDERTTWTVAFAAEGRGVSF